MQMDRNDNCHVHLPEKKREIKLRRYSTYCLRQRGMHLIPDLAHKPNRCGKTFFRIFACFGSLAQDYRAPPVEDSTVTTVDSKPVASSRETVNDANPGRWAR